MNNFNYETPQILFKKKMDRQKNDLIAYVALKKCVKNQTETINSLIQKMHENKKNKEQKEIEYMKHKIQSLESKIFMKNLENKQFEFLSSMKNGHF